MKQNDSLIINLGLNGYMDQILHQNVQHLSKALLYAHTASTYKSPGTKELTRKTPPGLCSYVSDGSIMFIQIELMCSVSKLSARIHVLAVVPRLTYFICQY